jgi:hypothetical protein
MVIAYVHSVLIKHRTQNIEHMERDSQHLNVRLNLIIAKFISRSVNVTIRSYTTILELVIKM